jgi:hypothetical protein
MIVRSFRNCAQTTEGQRRNELNVLVLAASLTKCRCRRRYAEQDCYWGRILGASLPTQIKACFSAMETSQFTFHQKV